MNKRAIRIITFIIISLGWSLLWFSQKYRLSPLFDSMNFRLVILFGLIPTIGLVVGGLISKSYMQDSEMTLLGKNPKISILFISIPTIGLAILGVKNILGIQPNIFGFLIGAFTFIYAFFEEIGWRGYLFDELKHSKTKWLSPVFIGLMWYLWHWFFLRQGGDSNFIMIPVLILASLGIGEVAKVTKSVLVCGAVHSLANMVMLYPIITNNLSNSKKIMLLVVCVVVWAYLLKTKYSIKSD